MPLLIDLVGRTPLCDLSAYLGHPGVTVLAKCEGANPGSSVKDRAAKGMITAALERGELTRGMRLIEATSGNTGIALAMISRALGIEMHLVMPTTLTVERIQTMEALGATVHLIDAGMEASRDYAEEQVRATKGSANAFMMLNQFANPDNPRAHYQTTGPEIWNDTHGTVTHFVSAMGTTGTIMGVSRYLKEQDPGITIIGCQPTEGSSIPGIRRWPKAYLPTIFEPSRVDITLDIAQKDAEDMCRRLAKEAGFFTGVSTGGAAWAAQATARGLQQGVVVFIACDRGDRYLSSDVFRPRS
jgi:cysteine synthase B